MHSATVLFCCFLGMSLNLATGSGMREVFRDDFDGSEVDRKKWYVTDMPSTFGAEQQYFLSENVVTGNGSLRITAHPISGAEEKKIDQQLKTNPFWTKRNYTSGMIYSQEKFYFKYGEVEWRAKIARGRGIVSGAFLLSPHCPPVTYCRDYWPPSIHPINARGQDPHTVNMKIHYMNQVPLIADKDYQGASDLSLEFHVYKVIWTETFVSFYVDDKEVLVLTDPKEVPSIEMQLVIKLAVGGPLISDPVPDGNTVFPAEFYVDYVVVRQFANQSADGTAVLRNAETSILAPVLGTVIPCTVILLCGLCLYAAVRYRRRGIAGNMRKYSAESTDTETTDLASLYSLAYLAYFSSGDAEIDAAVMDYVRLLEVPLANIITSDTILGRGQYGMVRKGVANGLRNQGSTVEIAIKTARDRKNPQHIRQLIEEVRMMSRTARHLNICNLLGVVLKGETLLLLEFCRYGCLLNYLKAHRGRLFYNHAAHNGDLLEYDDAEAQKLQAAVDRETTSEKTAKETDGQLLSTKDLMSFSFQISRGMEYLAGRSIIHRDLAARNVLIAEGRVLKICDFGMAKQMTEYVLLDEQVALPVRWMPPESLTERIYSQKSDVWSFGVVMWEIFTLGEVPYSHIQMDVGYVVELVNLLRNGKILERPMPCPTTIYDVMTECWRLQPELRPDFTKVVKSLKSAIGIDSAAYLPLEVYHHQFNAEHRQLLNKIASLRDS